MGYIIDPRSALRLLIESEKRGGHASLRHIGIANEAMMTRLYQEGRHGQIHWVSAFASNDDAGRAASQTLKNVPNEIMSKHDGAFSAVTESGFRVRFAMGNGVHSFTTTEMRMVIRPAAGQPAFYIKTFYPLPPNSFDKSIEPWA